MLAAAKYIGAGIACSGLIGAGAGIDYLTLILNISGFTIILITLGIILLKGGRGFIEENKTAANIATNIAAGAGAAGNSRDGSEDRIRTEEEDRTKAKKVDSFKNNIKSSSVILG